MKNIWRASLSLLFAVLLAACSNSDDGPMLSGLNPTEPGLDSQNFIWKAMNLWYFWQGDVPDLADDRFTTDQAYTAFLQATPDPLDFFQALNFSEDRFSVIYEDYQDLVNVTSGISQSNGLKFFLVQFSGSDNIFGVVRYIVPNSDAAAKDISRGEFFLTVDGQQLSLSNYIDLLFGDNATYTLGMADFDAATNTFNLNGKTVSLTKQQNLLEDPILVSRTLDVGGTQVGYLMYNSFNETFDEELNEAFGEFEANGVTELVLDLRYNGGGSVNTSRLLSSMIYGTFTNQVYVRQRYNAKIEPLFNNTRFFASQTGAGTPINTLNLTRVFILTSSSTASASELVINCLEPYIDVVQIGNVTVGKNESSLPLVDDPENSFIYDPDRESEINPNTPQGMLLLIGRSENADGFSDYTDGLVPDVELIEDVTNLGTLGEPDEPLLAEALAIISPPVAKRSRQTNWPLRPLAADDQFTALQLSIVRPEERKANQ